MKAGDRVRLINPEGYSNYQGTLLRQRDDFPKADDWWCVKWDWPSHPVLRP
jgi:hypothetical protein